MELNDLDFKLAAKNYDKFLDRLLYLIKNDTFHTTRLMYDVGRMALEAGKEIPSWLYLYTERHFALDLYIRTLSEEDLNTKLPEHLFNVGKFECVPIIKLLIEKGYDIPEKLLKHLEDLNAYYSSSDIYFQIVKSLLLTHKIPFNKIPSILLDGIDYVHLSNILSELLLGHRKKEITPKGWEILNKAGLIERAIKLKIITPEDVPSDIEIKVFGVFGDSFSFKNYFNRHIL